MHSPSRRRRPLCINKDSVVRSLRELSKNQWWSVFFQVLSINLCCRQKHLLTCDRLVWQKRQVLYLRNIKKCWNCFPVYKQITSMAFLWYSLKFIFIQYFHITKKANQGSNIERNSCLLLHCTWLYHESIIKISIVACNKVSSRCGCCLFWLFAALLTQLEIKNFNQSSSNKMVNFHIHYHLIKWPTSVL